MTLPGADRLAAAEALAALLDHLPGPPWTAPSPRPVLAGLPPPGARPRPDAPDETARGITGAAGSGRGPSRGDRSTAGTGAPGVRGGTSPRSSSPGRARSRPQEAPAPARPPPSGAGRRGPPGSRPWPARSPPALGHPGEAPGQQVPAGRRDGRGQGGPSNLLSWLRPVTTTAPGDHHSLRGPSGATSDPTVSSEPVTTTQPAHLMSGPSALPPGIWPQPNLQQAPEQEHSERHRTPNPPPHRAPRPSAGRIQGSRHSGHA
jgi:hypothetical protein